MDNKEQEKITKRFLKYSLEDIKFNYKWLTEEEKSFCTETQFNKLIEWVKKED